MRLFLVAGLWIVSVMPALAQTPAELDRACVTLGPVAPSYEPPAWLGDEAPQRDAVSDEAMRRLRLVVHREPLSFTHELANLRWGRCLLGLDDSSCEQAVGDFTVLVNTHWAHPRPDQTLFRLATLLVRAGETDRANETLLRLLEEHEGSPLEASALILLGQTHGAARDWTNARGYYLRAASLASQQRGLALYLGAWAAFEAGDTAAARRFAERALRATRGRAVHTAVRRDWCTLRGLP